MVVTVAVLSLLFQVGHFYEHTAQFVIWIVGDYSNICGRDTPWMSPWVTEGVRLTGIFLFPHDDAARQMMLGMELRISSPISTSSPASPACTTSFRRNG